jgi:hypothetical protein
MTSSIPMFKLNVILKDALYIENCITDPLGIIDKLEKESKYGKWINTNPDSNDCFDVKLNHAKNNLYYKTINLDNVDNKKLYVYNSLKMAFDFASDIYSKAFNLNLKNDLSLKVYKQSNSAIFDKQFIESSGLTIILFLNDTLDANPTKIKYFEQSQDIIPKKGSIIVIPPKYSYDIGYFLNENRYYSLANLNLI